ncbi:MAG: DHHA1 domain-containing protein, partial [Rhizobiaceae bacterium]
IKFMGRVVSGVQPKDMKPLANDAIASIGSGIVLFIGLSEDGKASAVVGVTEDLIAKHSAVDLVRIASAALGGAGGGGRADMAQAGGPDGSKANDAIAAVKAAI